MGIEMESSFTFINKETGVKNWMNIAYLLSVTFSRENRWKLGSRCPGKKKINNFGAEKSQ